MKNIVIIGAGNIGSRHLQALKAVDIPLDITVVDPNPDSIKIAKERYNSVLSGHYKHSINYFRNFNEIKDEFDIAIVATHSNIRRMVIEQLFEVSHVRAFILEKILFTKADDYSIVGNLLKEKKSKAWVNCTRRVIPFYKDKIRFWFRNKKSTFNISGSKWKLISNIIHFIDFMAFILNDNELSIEYDNLELDLVESNIPNFLELNGSTKIHFKKGSLGIISCFSTGTQPLIIDIASDEVRCIINETEGKSWVNRNSKKGWEVFESPILYTSQITSFLVESIIEKNECPLTPYEESMKLHLAIYENLLKFLNENFDKNFKSYPFT